MVAVDDCIIAVNTVPEAKAFNGVPVKRIKALRSVCPAKATTLLESNIMPTKNKPTPPINGKITSNIDKIP